MSSIGATIYAGYLTIGTDLPAICAEVRRTGGYGKSLDNTTGRSAQIGCW